MPIHWNRFTELVRSHDRFLLTSHIRPDCDALGSELGMAGVLEALGKDVLIVNAQQTPPNLAFIDPEQKLKTLGVDVEPSSSKPAKCCMVLDTSAWAQLGTMADVVRASKAHKAILDHHVGEDDLGRRTVQGSQGRSHRSAGARRRTPPGRAGHARDRPPAVRGHRHRHGLVSLQFHHRHDVPLRRRSGRRRRRAQRNLRRAVRAGFAARGCTLRGRILARTQTELDGRLAHTAALKEDFEETGALPSDTEDVVNMTLAIAGTEAAFILVEQQTGGFKISFRSRTPAVDCNQLAKDFGGGGHKAAAGGFTSAPWPEAQNTGA